MADQDFFRIVNKRNTGPNGEVLDCNLLRRMEHPICQRCHADYRKKYSGQPFKIVCEGIWEDDEIAELATEAGIPFEDAKENFNSVFWAERHIKLTDDNGQKVPFKARYYQAEILRCTALRKVDRTGRGMGKTCMGVIEELHKATTKRNYEILVVTPAKAQVQKWFTDIKDHINADDDLRATLVGTPKQAPYFEFVFKNGSNIRLFCTGASGGDNIRTQTPRRVRMDEQDYLDDEDYKAIQPFFRRYKNSEVHGSSTPTGARGMYYKMCRKLPDYKEFHFPITAHPDFSTEMEEACRAEARTELVYLHEYMADFGELESGVFKPEYIELSLKDYVYTQCSRSKNDLWKYFIGVDWNGRGTGTRIRVIAFNPETKIRRVVDRLAVSQSVMASLEAIRQMNKRWNADEIYIDAGFGFAQDELLKLIGQNSNDLDDKRLLDIKSIDFGASIEFNKLVPKRDKVMYINDEDNELSRRTKPFMVEGMQMVVEQGLFEFSNQDALLEEQMRAYKVKNYSAHGWANTYETNDEIGDHDLDAVMLALLAIELKYGLFWEHRLPNRVASGMEFLPGFGVQSHDANSDLSVPEQIKQGRMAAAQIPSRRSPSEQIENKLLWFNSRTLPFSGTNQTSAIVAPRPRKGPQRPGWGSAGTGSRTGIFRRRNF